MPQEFTGVSNRYESPDDAEIVIGTTDLTSEKTAERIVQYLEQERYVRPCR